MAAVVIYDAAASAASLALGIPYASAAVGALLVYAAAGFFAARAKSRWFSVLVGVVVGLTDATAGWGISWALGPGRSSSGAITLAQWLIAAASVIVLASVCAGVGGVIGGFARSRKTPANKAL